MTPQKNITYKNRFFSRFNPYTPEIHTYSETDFVEIYKGFSIWKFETNCRNDGSRKFDIIKDKIIIKSYGGDIDIDGVKKKIDEDEMSKQILEEEIDNFVNQITKSK